MNLSKLMPRRADAKEQARLVSDIDKIVSTPVAFMLHGKKRILKPITTEEFLIFTKAYNEFSLSIESKDTGPKDVIKNLHNVFSSVCDEISIPDIQEMTQTQVGALYALILRTVSGEIFSEENQEQFEKKTLKQLDAAGMT